MDQIIDQVKAIILALEAEGWESMIFIEVVMGLMEIKEMTDREVE
jgi:hypothetical protein